MHRALVLASAGVFAAASLLAAADGGASAVVAPPVVAPPVVEPPVVEPPVVEPPVVAPPGGIVLAVPHSVSVALTASGCAPAAVTVPAGPVTFAVTNEDTPGVSEAELAGADGVLLAEAEDVGPGLSGGFSLALAPGSYVLGCQATTGTAQRLRLTVTAPQQHALTAAEAVTHHVFAAAAGDYATYARAEAAELLTTTRAFTQALVAGDVALAKSRYALARVHYERIESVAESFGQLDALIDERVDDVPPGRSWSGFHRLEDALWASHDLTGTPGIAGELDLAVADLQVLVDRSVTQPAQLADGAAALLSEVGATKITGEEERYSHLDALDLAANVAGAQQAATLLLPGLRRLDPAAATLLARRFQALDGVVAALPAAVRADWRRATPRLRSRLSAAVDAAAAPLASIAAEVAAA